MARTIEAFPEKTAQQCREHLPETADYDFVALTLEAADNIKTSLQKAAQQFHLKTINEPSTNYQTVTVHHTKLAPSGASAFPEKKLSIDITVPKSQLTEAPLPPANLTRQSVIAYQANAESAFRDNCKTKTITPTSEMVKNHISGRTRKYIGDYISKKMVHKTYPIQKSWQDFWQTKTRRLITESDTILTQDLIRLPCIHLSDWLEMLDLQLQSAAQMGEIFLELQQEEDVLYGRTPRQTLDTTQIPPSYQSYINKKDKALHRLQGLAKLAQKHSLEHARQGNQIQLFEQIRALEYKHLPPSPDTSSDDEIFEDAQDSLSDSETYEDTSITMPIPKGCSNWKQRILYYLKSPNSYSHWIFHNLGEIFIQAKNIQKEPKSKWLEDCKKVRNNYARYLETYDDERHWLISHSPEASTTKTLLDCYFEFHREIVHTCIEEPLEYLLQHKNQPVQQASLALANNETTLLETITTQAEDLCLIFTTIPNSTLLTPWLNTLMLPIITYDTIRLNYCAYQTMLRQVFNETDLHTLFRDLLFEIDEQSLITAKLNFMLLVPDYTALQRLFYFTDTSSQYSEQANKEHKQIAQLLPQIIKNLSTELQRSSTENPEAASAASTLHQSSTEGWLSRYINGELFTTVKQALSDLEYYAPTPSIKLKDCGKFYQSHHGRIHPTPDIQPTVRPAERPELHEILSNFILKKYSSLISSFHYKHWIKMYIKHYAHIRTRLLENIKKTSDSLKDRSTETLHQINFSLISQSKELKAYLVNGLTDSGNVKQEHREMRSAHHFVCYMQAKYFCNEACKYSKQIPSCNQHTEFSQHISQVLQILEEHLEYYAFSQKGLVERGTDTEEAEDLIQVLCVLTHNIFNPVFIPNCPDGSKNHAHKLTAIHELKKQFDQTNLTPTLLGILSEMPFIATKNSQVLLQKSHCCQILLVFLNNDMHAISEQIKMLDRQPPLAITPRLLVMTIQAICSQIAPAIKCLQEATTFTPEAKKAKALINTVISSIDQGWLGQQWLTFTGHASIPDNCNLLKVVGTHLPEFHEASERLSITRDIAREEQAQTPLPTKKKKRKRKKQRLSPVRTPSPINESRASSSEPETIEIPLPQLSPWEAKFKTASELLGEENLEEKIKIYSSLAEEGKQDPTQYSRATIELTQANISLLRNRIVKVAKIQTSWRKYKDTLIQGNATTPPKLPMQNNIEAFKASLVEMSKLCTDIKEISNRYHIQMNNLSKVTDPQMKAIIPSVQSVLAQHYGQLCNSIPTMEDIHKLLNEVKSARKQLMRSIGEHKQASGLDIGRNQPREDLITLMQVLEQIDTLKKQLQTAPSQTT